MFETSEANAKKAQQCDQAALEELIAQIQEKVYGLALRMLWHPEDAQDATQEILLRVVTHLATFRGESTFFTWVYRIAANHLLRFRKSRLEAQGSRSKGSARILRRVCQTAPSIRMIPFCFRRSEWDARWGCFCAWIVRTALPTFWVTFWKWTGTKRRQFCA